MSIKPTFNMASVRAYIKERQERTEKAIIETYKFVGEGFVRDARSKVSDTDYTKALAGLSHARNGRRAEISAETPSFKDHTGNLRSSIGYIILKNGRQVGVNFEEAENGTEKAAGKEKGKSFAETLAANYPTGIALIVVAGMEYAAAVESKGYDVITGSSLGVESRLRTLLKNIK